MRISFQERKQNKRRKEGCRVCAHIYETCRWIIVHVASTRREVYGNFSRERAIISCRCCFSRLHCNAQIIIKSIPRKCLYEKLKVHWTSRLPIIIAAVITKLALPRYNFSVWDLIKFSHVANQSFFLTCSKYSHFSRSSKTCKKSSTIWSRAVLHSLGLIIDFERLEKWYLMQIWQKREAKRSEWAKRHSQSAHCVWEIFFCIKKLWLWHH